jgi:hypothetical protein
MARTRRRRGRPPNSERPVPPTPETLVKLAPNALHDLRQEHQQAADANDRAHQALCAGMMPPSGQCTGL